MRPASPICRRLPQTSHLTHHLFGAVRRCWWQRVAPPSTQAVRGNRSRRTARAGRGGVGCLVLTEKQRDKGMRGLILTAALSAVAAPALGAEFMLASTE